jgi:hypothetical protein
VLAAHSHAAPTANHRSPPIPKLQKFRKDPPRIDPSLNNELMIHGYSDKFYSKLKEEQAKLAAKPSPEHQTPSTLERIPIISPKHALISTSKTSEPIKAAHWEKMTYNRAYQSGNKKTIYFSCDINDKGPPAAQSVGPSRRSTVQATEAAASATRVRERLHASLDIDANFPEDSASTPSRGLKGTKVKTQQIKKLIPHHQ